MNPIVRGRLCTCGQPAPNGLSLHPECATEELAARVRARSGAEVAREQRTRDAELTTAAAAARRVALAQATALASALRDEYQATAQRATLPGGQALTLEAAVQRRAAIVELLQRLEALTGDGGGE